MYKFNYKLGTENLSEMNCYLAIHDLNIQKKMISLMISIAIMALIVLFFIFNLSIPTLIGMVITAILELLIFPKIYWKIVFSRIEKTLSFRNIEFKDTTIEFNDKVSIDDQINKIAIEYSNIINMDFTKHNCLIFYTYDDKSNTLIIPNDVIGEKLEEFCLFIQKETSYVK
ncbi:MAG: hypothetical protein RR585_14085 [Coprobacillus sp.]